MDRRVSELMADSASRRPGAKQALDLTREPVPDAYLRAAEMLGVSPTDGVAVEDSCVGAHAAEAAGCGVVVVGPAGVSRDAGARMVRMSLLGLGVADLEQALALRDPCIGARQ
jgi:beta-phosphoglucomutase-like phosphatase (HAD superfamily)